MKSEKWYFSELVEQSVRKHLETNKKILLLINKSGYASWIFCRSCAHIPQCKNCSVSIAYHEAENGMMYGICPICKHLYDKSETCEQCWKSDLHMYGITTQRAQERIKKTFGITPLVIDNKQTSSLTKSRKVLEEINNNAVVIGTNALIPSSSRGAFDTVIVLAADQLLTLPDYDVRSNSFYNLTRIFTNFWSKFFLVQSYDTDHISIRSGCKLDEEWFLANEKVFKSLHHYPPYGELCIIKYNHENETSLHNAIQKLNQELQYLLQSYEYKDIEIYSSSPMIYKKFGKYYYHIVLKGASVRPFLDIAFSKLRMAQRGYKIDRMADSLL